VILDTPLSPKEIDELNAFLMSDATPEDCMHIVTLDGFLTALAIGPKLVLPREGTCRIFGAGGADNR